MEKCLKLEVSKIFKFESECFEIFENFSFLFFGALSKKVYQMSDVNEGDQEWTPDVCCQSFRKIVKNFVIF